MLLHTALPPPSLVTKKKSMVKGFDAQQTHTLIRFCRTVSIRRSYVNKKTSSPNDSFGGKVVPTFVAQTGPFSAVYTKETEQKRKVEVFHDVHLFQTFFRLFPCCCRFPHMRLLFSRKPPSKFLIFVGLTTTCLKTFQAHKIQYTIRSHFEKK